MKANQDRCQPPVDLVRRISRTECVSRLRSANNILSSRSDTFVDQSTPNQDALKLADILDSYLQQLEAGSPTDVEQLIARHPEHEEQLREYLAGLQFLNTGIADMSDSPFRFDDERPQVLGNYELVREIGRGGMGVVYEATQTSLDRRVALKVLPFASMLDPRQVVRFDTEARAAGRLHHPHIVPVHEVGCDQGVHYYAMQYIEGSSIRTLIETGKSNGEAILPLEAARLAVQAANALDMAHSYGIVHRDIKPSNLLLDAKQDLWIADFGLARTQQSDKNVTQSGDILGTLHYMSPEQIRGDSCIADPRSDIYSLGVTLFELLTLRRPFSGDSHTIVLQQIASGDYQSVRAFNPDVPRSLENVVTKATALDAEHRYQSVAEFEADLKRFISGKATLAKPPSCLQKATCWATRNRCFLASCCILLTVAVLALTCSTVWLAGERQTLESKHRIADEKLKATEATLETFGMATAERLKNIPGTGAAREALLSDLLIHYQQLLAVSDKSPSLRIDRAITSTKIANLYRESGNLRLALQGYQEAEKDLRLLSQPTSTCAQRGLASYQLAKCQSNMSIVLLEMSEVDKAFKTIHCAIKSQTERVAGDSSTAHLMDLAASYVNLASIEDRRLQSNQKNHLHLTSGSHLSDGLSHLRLAATLLGQAKQRCSPVEQRRVFHTLSSIYGRLSSQLRTTDPSTATRYAAQATECSRHLVEHHSERDSDDESRRLYAINSNNLASLYFDQHNPRQAIPFFEIAAAQLERTENQEGLVSTLVNLAKSHAAASDPSRAAAAYRRALTAQSAILLHSPGDLNQVSRIGGLHNNLAIALQNCGELQRACISYESALQFQERAYQLAPRHLSYYRDAFSRTLFNAGKAFAATERPLLAVDFHLQRSKLWPNDPHQLFSVTREIATLLSHVPHSKQREHCVSKANEVLQRAMRCDVMGSINQEQLTQLQRHLSKVERSRS